MGLFLFCLKTLVFIQKTIEKYIVLCYNKLKYKL